MTSQHETATCRALRSILAENPVGADLKGEDPRDRLRDLRLALEYFIPEALKENYAEWRWDALDSVEAVTARISNESEAEILGMAILMNDQTLVLLHVRLGLDDLGDQLRNFDIRLGEVTKTGMVRIPMSRHDALWKRVYLMEGDPEGIEWMYLASR